MVVPFVRTSVQGRMSMQAEIVEICRHHLQLHVGQYHSDDQRIGAVSTYPGGEIRKQVI